MSVTRIALILATLNACSPEEEIDGSAYDIEPNLNDELLSGFYSADQFPQNQILGDQSTLDVPYRWAQRINNRVYSYVNPDSSSQPNMYEPENWQTLNDALLGSASVLVQRIDARSSGSGSPQDPETFLITLFKDFVDGDLYAEAIEPGNSDLFDELFDGSLTIEFGLLQAGNYISPEHQIYYHSVCNNVAAHNYRNGLAAPECHGDLPNVEYFQHLGTDDVDPDSNLDELVLELDSDSPVLLSMTDYNFTGFGQELSSLVALALGAGELMVDEELGAQASSYEEGEGPMDRVGILQLQ